jgi:predicted unusual protein kinase regulating ubiquinone biosynthesis (AarF/ABC1/UbiB family)
VSARRRVRIGPAERMRRARRISTTFGRVYLGLRTLRWIERRLAPSDMEERWRRFHRESASTVYDAAIELHGLILKACQLIGTRADVMPREWVEKLSVLQDRVPAHPWPVVRETVEAELGTPIEEVFESFAQEPVASASLAQVHEARLHGGERVAVKVQYPEIEALIRGDLKNLRALFRAVDLLESDFDIMPLIDELGTYVPRELNFVNEGRNAEAIGRFFKDRPDIAVPRVHWEFTTRRVLVSEFIEGVKPTDVEGLRSLGVDGQEVARILLDAYCEQVLVHGFFHADPHPGNLLIQRSPDGAARLVFLDFGLAKELPPQFRSNALSFATALLGGDLPQMTEALFDLGFETRDGRPESLEDISAFVLDIAQRHRHGVSIDPEFTDRFAREVPERIRRNPIVRVPTDLVLLGRVVALLSGVNKSLGSKLDLARTLLPYATKKPPGDAR